MVDDGRTTDGRTPEHGYTISSPCEPDGSGELKIYVSIISNDQEQVQSEPVSSQGNKAGLNIIQYTVYHCTQLYERPRGKTINVVSEQVRHKQGCTNTEDG